MEKNTNLNELLDEALGLIKAKEFDKAIPVYEAILKLDDMLPKALSHLAIIYLMKERYLEAIDMIHKSFEVVEPVIGDYENLAIAYRALKDYKKQVYVYEKIIQINTNDLETYKLLGDAKIEIGDRIGAVDTFKKALDLGPDKFQQRYDYGLALYLVNSHEEALKHLRKALEIDPNHIECMNKIAGSFSAIGNYKKAKSIYQKIKKLAPDALAPHADYATCLFFEGKYDEPVKILKEVLLKKPNIHAVRLNLGMLYLTHKNFKEGWEHYEARTLWRNDEGVGKRYEKLMEFFDLDVGKKKLNSNDNILILFESGIGDVILALSMLKDFHENFKNISAEVDYRLVNICRRSFTDIKFYPVRELPNGELIIKHDLSHFDKGIYWGSIGRYVRKNILDFPKQKKAYLNQDNTKNKEIQNKLKKDKEIICGISWKSNAVEGRHKSTKLKNLLPILSIKGIKFLDLQYEKKNNVGQTAIEKEELFKKNNIMIEEYEGIDKFEDIDGILALISNCDIVVTSSNVTAHIAGALGKKTFLFLPLGRGKLWYWHEEGGKSLWYPSIKIFTAESPGKWGKVFKKIANVIEQELI